MVSIDRGLKAFISSVEKNACPITFIPSLFDFAWIAMISLPSIDTSDRRTILVGPPLMMMPSMSRTPQVDERGTAQNS